MKKLALLIVIAGALLQPGPAAASCAGPPPSARQAWTDAAAVFSGKVVSIKSNGLLGFPASSNSVQFQVNMSWKGVTSNSVVLTSYPTSVDYTFEEGQSYLVYAHRGDPEGKGNVLNASSCGRTALLADAGADLQELGPGAAISGAGEAPRGQSVAVVGASVAGMLLVLIATVVLFVRRARRPRHSAPAATGEAVLPRHSLRGARERSGREVSHGDGGGPA